MKRLFFIIFIAFLWMAPGSAQIIVRNDSITTLDTDSIRRAYDRGPYFSFYKDNYFIGGIPIGERPTKENSNVKFQISVRQRLTNSVLPFHSFLYLFYTQKCFWNILENSMPMTDLNFNPGIGWSKPFFSKQNGSYVGAATLILEHESNGRDGADSRSWNRISIGGEVFIDKNMQVNGKYWIPIIDGVNNKDILNYCGVFQVGIQLMSDNRRFGVSLQLTKRKDWNVWNYNLQLDLKWRLFKNDNQYLFLQYYNGYGEGLLAYKEFHSMLRVGICLCPKFFSEY